MRKLTNRVAFITGGASGIGKALGEEIAARGGEVWLADRQIELAEEAARAITARGGKATALELDVRDLTAFERAAEGVMSRSGRIDLLFNNAGIGVGGEMASYDRAAWDDVFDVNIKGVAYGVQAFLPHMIAQRSGHIINTASVAGLAAAPSAGSYCAAKHAVVGLTKALRIEVERHGVRASVLCPGAIRTPILGGGRYGRLGYQGVTKEQALAQWEHTRPMDPAVFARRALDDVLDNVAIIIHPRWWRALWYVDRVSPTIGMKLMAAVHARLRRELGVTDGAAARPREKVQPQASVR